MWATTPEPVVSSGFDEAAVVGQCIFGRYSSTPVWYDLLSYLKHLIVEFSVVWQRQDSAVAAHHVHRHHR